MRILVLGAGGFIGSHLVKRLKRDGYWVMGVDKKYPEFTDTEADSFVRGDLRDPRLCDVIFDQHFGEVYQLAAEMGGAGYDFTGENDAEIMHNSALINLNIISNYRSFKRIFFSSSVCVYSGWNQGNDMSEDKAYPANPLFDYGWEKLSSERLYFAFHRNHGVDIRIARYQNTFGEEGTWRGGREKSPAAICRKIAEAEDGCTIEMWGDGEQTRPFIHVDETVEGTIRIMRSEHTGPFNLGTEEVITINRLAEMIMQVANKKVNIKHIPGPTGAERRMSNSDLLYEKLGWKPTKPIMEGLEKTYPWILEQVERRNNANNQ